MYRAQKLYATLVAATTVWKVNRSNLSIEVIHNYFEVVFWCCIKIILHLLTEIIFVFIAG